MERYDHKRLEPKWQEVWEKAGANRAREDVNKKKFYGLIEFPYPSGEGLHAGHVRSNTAMDVIARKRRAQGYEVLYPIGWDAFGLPTENYAIKTGIHPSEVTKKNTDTFRRQLKSLGFSFDWDREINTTDPAYFKWTQWIFLQLYKHGLAYKTTSFINWCPKCKIGLANEEAAGGVCERCDGPTEKRQKEQWMLAITKYAQRLYDDLDTVNYIERAKVGQRNWIGPSEGAEIDFRLAGSEEKITVFTTRPDTLFGVTYVVLAPEHPLVAKFLDDSFEFPVENKEEVRAYVASAAGKEDMERTAEQKEKTGVELRGVRAINPANGEEIPVWVADYVLGSYGTGAVMAVPAHDERDFAFAKKFGLPVEYVISPVTTDEKNPPKEGKKEVYRKIVHAVVRNTKGQTMLLRWKGEVWDAMNRHPVTFLAGGVEDGEDVVEAARREVLEEAGYKHLTHKATLPMTIRVNFFAAHKDENRVGDVQCVVFELADEERGEVSEEERAKHDCVFVDDAQVLDMLNIPDDLILWKHLQGMGAFSEDGIVMNSGEFSGMDSEDAKKKITEKVEGRWVTKFKLRDWVFSRQHYWGEPVPLVKCAKDGWVPVPESELPLVLPKVEKYQPTDNGESPLAAITEWVNTTCPKCGGPAKRETDTMPNWAGSSWYYLRYCDPRNDTALASAEALKYWTPVDWYNGGMEHTTLHLLYSRFWHKFLFDIGAVPTSEPYQKRTSNGLILAGDGTKMSKSKGNVVNPDAIVEQFGADSLRLYEMFMGPFEQDIAWSTDGIVGVRRFLERVWKLAERAVDADAPALEMSLHQTIKKVGDDIEQMKFNTAVSQMMIFLNVAEKEDSIGRAQMRDFVRLLAPFAPHITEELWESLGGQGGVHVAAWPQFDEAKLTSDTVRIVVQINGKARGEVTVSSTASEAEVVEVAKTAMADRLLGQNVSRHILVPGRLVNLVLAQ